MAKGRPASLRSQWQWASATQNARMRYAAQLTLGDFELVVNLANYANIDLRTNMQQMQHALSPCAGAYIDAAGAKDKLPRTSAHPFRSRSYRSLALRLT